MVANEKSYCERINQMIVRKLERKIERLNFDIERKDDEIIRLSDLLRIDGHVFIAERSGWLKSHRTYALFVHDTENKYIPTQYIYSTGKIYKIITVEHKPEELKTRIMPKEVA